MLLLMPEDLKAIADHAEAAYPGEACGLLVGFHRADGDIEVTKVAESRNLAAAQSNKRFEVDPELRFRLMREARDQAPAALPDAARAIVGHYHSHPDGPARPSAVDLARAYEPDLVWLITSVIAGQAVQSTAHLLSPGGTRFDDIGLAVLSEDREQ
jgi:proteasome lid subunit RPN8/RPN11